MSDTIMYVYMLWRSIVCGKIDWVSNVARSNVQQPNVLQANVVDPNQTCHEYFVNFD